MSFPALKIRSQDDKRRGIGSALSSGRNSQDWNEFSRSWTADINATCREREVCSVSYSHSERGSGLLKEHGGVMYDLHLHRICFTNRGPKQLQPMLSRNVFSSAIVGRASRNAFSAQTVWLPWDVLGSFALPNYSWEGEIENAAKPTCLEVCHEWYGRNVPTNCDHYWFLSKTDTRELGKHEQMIRGSITCISPDIEIQFEKGTTWRMSTCTQTPPDWPDYNMPDCARGVTRSVTSSRTSSTNEGNHVLRCNDRNKLQIMFGRNHKFQNFINDINSSAE